MEAAAVMNAWKRSYAETPPIGFLLRDDQPSAWVRLHTLPSGKRVPSKEHERRVVIERWNELAGLVLRDSEAVGTFVLDSEISDRAVGKYAVERVNELRSVDDVR
jgi:hypothetical protein